MSARYPGASASSPAGLGGLLECPRGGIARVEQREEFVGREGSAGSAGATRQAPTHPRQHQGGLGEGDLGLLGEARRQFGERVERQQVAGSDKRERPARGRDRLGAGGKRRLLLGGQVPEAYERRRVVLDAAGEGGCGPRQLVVVATPAGPLLQVRFEQVGRAGPWPGRELGQQRARTLVSV